jgi:hypothetical protein
LFNAFKKEVNCGFESFLRDTTPTGISGFPESCGKLAHVIWLKQSENQGEAVFIGCRERSKKLSRLS